MLKIKIELILPLPPSVNSLYQNQARYDYKTKKYQLTGKRILSKEGEKIKKKIRLIGLQAVKNSKWNLDLIGDSFIYMDLVIYFNRRGRDADNILKALQDSLQDVLFKNDSQVLPRTQKIMYDKKNPRIELSLSLVDYKGIFNSQEEAIEFESKCKSCSRYRDGRCSILVDSYSAVIREEIDTDKSCLEYREKKS